MGEGGGGAPELRSRSSRSSVSGVPADTHLKQAAREEGAEEKSGRIGQRVADPKRMAPSESPDVKRKRGRVLMDLEIDEAALETEALDASRS